LNDSQRMTSLTDN